MRDKLIHSKVDVATYEGLVKMAQDQGRTISSLIAFLLRGSLAAVVNPVVPGKGKK